jgi:3-oxoacyl-[acyl-carrier protein] reductase
MDLGLRDRVALVTGGWRGTGAGISAVLAAEGATVLVHGADEGLADATVATITDLGGRAHAVHGDIRTDAGADDLRASAGRITDHVDIVVNNYGVADGTTWERSTGESWHASYDTNVVSAIRVVDAFVEPMRDRGWGRILFVATVGATRPGDRNPEYYAAKGALPAITVSLAKHLAGTGITVNCLSPGLIATAEVIERFTAAAERDGAGSDWPAVERYLLDRVMANPSGRVPFPEDIGRVVAMVVGEPSWHVNGAHLRVDGGAADAVT